MVLEVYDKNGRPIDLGTMVSYRCELKSGTVTRIGSIYEIRATVDGSVHVRISGGQKAKLFKPNEVTAVDMNRREDLIVKEFSKHGVALSLEDAKQLASMLAITEGCEELTFIDHHHTMDEQGTEEDS